MLSSRVGDWKIVCAQALSGTSEPLARPKVILNLETDDFGIVEERHCGCELESYGYTTHLREVRSYSKLTGEGVTLIGDEMIHILETTSPRASEARRSTIS